MRAEEAVGRDFQEDSLRSAQAQAWKALRETASRLKPGDTELIAASVLKEVCKASGVEKIWHPPQIRFGINTIKAFGKPSEPEVQLQTNDVFFLDIGPVFGGHEGDVGETFVIGNNPEHIRITKDAREVFGEVRTEWLRSGKTGAALYEFASQRAKARGWVLSLNGASGHRVSDFPHAVHFRGKLKGFDAVPTPGRWILEIHLIDPQERFGAFFEDLL